MVTPVAFPAAANRPSPAAASQPLAPAPAASFGPSAEVTLSPEALAPQEERQPEPPPQPLALSVDRADNGVFVYTLREPSTGAVIAVIPRAQVQGGQNGQVDQKV